MVGSEIDQKYLGILAEYTQPFHEELSMTLFRLLGLSSLLARKLYRARKQRKLDPTRATKSLDLYRHIIWMSKEGFIMIEEIINNIIGDLISTQFAELRVLVYKLRASFLHIFVLFDCRYQATTLLPASLLGGHAPPPPPNSNIETHDYLEVTIGAFKHADELAGNLLPAIHPLRLSVKLEYSAFTFDCIRDEDAGRRIAKKAIDDAFVCTDKLDDDAFEDATHLVGALGVFAKRNLTRKQKPQPEGPTSPRRPMSYALSQSSANEFSYIPPNERGGQPTTIDEGAEYDGEDSGPEDSELYAKKESERRQQRWNMANGKGANDTGRPGTADSEDPRDYYEQRNRPLSPIEVDFRKQRQPMVPIGNASPVFYDEPGEITPKASRNNVLLGGGVSGPAIGNGNTKVPLIPQPAFDARKPPTKPTEVADNRRPSTSGSANSGNTSKRYHIRKVSADGTPLPKGAGKGVGVPIEQAYEVIETGRFGPNQRQEWKQQLEQQMQQPQRPLPQAPASNPRSKEVSPVPPQQEFMAPSQPLSPPPPTPPPKDDPPVRRKNVVAQPVPVQQPVQQWKDPHPGELYYQSPSPPQSPYAYTSEEDAIEDPNILIEPSELANRHSDSDDKRNAFYQLPEDQYTAPGWQGIASPPIEEYRMRQLSRISEESYSTIGANTSGNGAFNGNGELHRNVSTRSKRSKGSKNSKRSGSGRSTNRNSTQSSYTSGTGEYLESHNELHEPHDDYLEPPITPAVEAELQPPRSPRDRKKMHLPPQDLRLGLESPVYEEQYATAVPITRAGPFSPIRTNSKKGGRPQTSYGDEEYMVGNVQDRTDTTLNRPPEKWVDRTPRDREFPPSSTLPPPAPSTLDGYIDQYDENGILLSSSSNLARSDSYRRGEPDVLSVTPVATSTLPGSVPKSRPVHAPPKTQLLSAAPPSIPTPSPAGSTISLVSSRADPTSTFDRILSPAGPSKAPKSSTSSATNITAGNSYFHDPTPSSSTNPGYGRSEVTSPVTSFEVDVSAGFGNSGHDGRGVVYGRREGDNGYGPEGVGRKR